jgi:hypothetical protein
MKEKYNQVYNQVEFDYVVSKQLSTSYIAQIIICVELCVPMYYI